MDKNQIRKWYSYSKNNGVISQKSNKQWSQAPTSIPTNFVTVNANSGTVLNHQVGSQTVQVFSNLKHRDASITKLSKRSWYTNIVSSITSETPAAATTTPTTIQYCDKS